MKKPQSTLTSFGVECLLRPMGVQVTEVDVRGLVGEVAPGGVFQNRRASSVFRLKLQLNFNFVSDFQKRY